MFQARLFVEHKDLPVITSWFKSRNFPAPLPGTLPEVGLVITNDGKDISSGFLFSTDSHVGMIAHLVSDPESDKDLRKESVKYLINSLSDMARELGNTVVTCATNIDSLGKRFEEYGFEKTDTNVSHYRRVLCQ